MSLIVFVVLGVVIGLLARALLPDRGLDSVGPVPAALAGSVAGGVIVTLLTGTDLVEVSSAPRRIATTAPTRTTGSPA